MYRTAGLYGRNERGKTTIGDRMAQPYVLGSDKRSRAIVSPRPWRRRPSASKAGFWEIDFADPDRRLLRRPQTEGWRLRALAQSCFMSNIERRPDATTWPSSRWHPAARVSGLVQLCCLFAVLGETLEVGLAQEEERSN